MAIKQKRVFLAFGTLCCLTVGALLLSVSGWTAGSSPQIKLRQPQAPTMGPVIFQHWAHQRHLKCYSCHPVHFSQTKSELFGHEEMKRGKRCGSCHDGKNAFEVNDESADCEVCHAK